MQNQHNYSDELTTKADRRAKKKRPRMQVHGASLKRGSKFSGLKAAKTKAK